MESTGIVRRIDDLGRVVLPAELRSTLGIKTGQPLEFLTRDDEVVLMLYRPGCTFCGSSGQEAKLTKHKDRDVCHKCILELTEYLLEVEVKVEG